MTPPPSKSLLLRAAGSPLLPVIALGLIYAWSLTFGYLWDDIFEVRRDFPDSLSRLQEHFRPLYYLSFALTNPLFDSAFEHRLVNYVLLLATAGIGALWAARLGVPVAGLVILATFLHPTFVYPATWISQRNDLLLLLLLFLALLHLREVRGFWYLLLSDLSKSPFVLHTLWFAGRFWLDGHRVRALMAFAIVPLLIAHMLLFWQGVSETASSPMGGFEREGIVGLAVMLLVRGAKVAEGVFLALAPIAAFYEAVPHAMLALIVAVYAGAWGALLWSARGSQWPMRPVTYVVLALLNALPFAINSDPRVIGPVIALLWPALFMFARKGSGLAPTAAVVLLALNLWGTMLNYGISDTGAYRPDEAPDYVLCAEREVQYPMERWRCERNAFAHQIIQGVNRTFQH